MMLLHLDNTILLNIVSYLPPSTLIPLSLCNHRLYQLISPFLHLSLSLPTEQNLLETLMQLLYNTPSVARRVTRLQITEPISNVLKKPLYTEDVLTQLISTCCNVSDVRLGVGKCDPTKLRFYQTQPNAKLPWNIVPGCWKKLTKVTVHDYGDDADTMGIFAKSRSRGLVYLDMANCVFHMDDWRRLALNHAATLEELFLFNTSRRPGQMVHAQEHLVLHPYQLEIIARSSHLRVLHYRPEAPLSPESRNQLRDALALHTQGLVTLVLEHVGRLDSRFWHTITACEKLKLLILTDGTYSGDAEEQAMHGGLKTMPELQGFAVDANHWEWYDGEWVKRVLGECTHLKWLRVEGLAKSVWGTGDGQDGGLVTGELDRWRAGWGGLVDGGFEWRQELDEDMVETVFETQYELNE
jgi:hypothetical protein